MHGVSQASTGSALAVASASVSSEVPSPSSASAAIVQHGGDDPASTAIVQHGGDDPAELREPQFRSAASLEPGARKRMRDAPSPVVGAVDALVRDDGSTACRFAVEELGVLVGGCEHVQFRCLEKGCAAPLAHLLTADACGTDAFMVHAALHATGSMTAKQRQQAHLRALGGTIHGIELACCAFACTARDARRLRHDDVRRLDAWAASHLHDAYVDALRGRADLEPLVVLDAPTDAPTDARGGGALPRVAWRAPSTQLAADRCEYAAVHGALRFLHQSSRRLQLASPGRSTATHHSVSKLLGDLETPALHPSLTLPHLITRIPAQQQRLSQTDGERRAALLALIGLPDDRLLPARWDFVQHEHVWVLLMHARCDLPVHVDYSATGSTRRPHPPAAPPARTPTPPPPHPLGCPVGHSRP